MQNTDGAVEVLLCEGEDVGREGREALAAESARLTSWLDGVVITNVYMSQLIKQLPLP